MKVLRAIFGDMYDVPAVKFILEMLFVLLPIAFFIRTAGFGLYQVPTGSMEPTLLVGERFFADKLSYWFRKPQRGEIIAFNDPYYEYSKNPILKLWEQYAWGPDNWTKRVIGLPGETVKGVIENGKPVIYINGTKLKEDYVNKYPLIRVWTTQHFANKSLFKEVQNKSCWKTYDSSFAFDDQPFYQIKEGQLVLNSFSKPIIYWPGVPDESGADVFEVKLSADEYFVCGDNRRGSTDSRFWGKLKGNTIHGKIIFRIWSMDSDESWWFVDLIKHPIDFWKKIRWSRCLQFVK